MHSPVTRLILVRVPRGEAPAGSAPVRRYRLARVAMAGQRLPGDDRYAHIKRCYD